jgi:hypothetical protein
VENAIRKSRPQTVPEIPQKATVPQPPAVQQTAGGNQQKKKQPQKQKQGKRK